MERESCQINVLPFFDRIIDWLMEATVWIQRQFHFSEVFALVSQGILIKTWRCGRGINNCLICRFDHVFSLSGPAETGY